jgi:hypothetical protein
MYIVMYNITQTVEVSYVHCNVQQYTEFGGFFCALSCTRVHREWTVIMFIRMYNNTHILEVSYVHFNVQQYTGSRRFLCAL